MKTAVATLPAAREGRRIEVTGICQGVGFRPWVYRVARELGLTGRVFNHARGVSIEAYGPADQLARLLEAIREAPPPGAEIRELRSVAIPPRPQADFVIVASAADGDRRVSIPPDLATCPQCAAEVSDPADRRFGYPFTNCTHCGPRFTIALDAPYDRPATTMAGFRMCPECQREYEDPDDRRHHAQPNACPECGPRLALVGPGGAPVPGGHERPIALAAAALREGRIVAVKGIGGFHLACDATCADAVRRLRERKRRDEKPFAVMVADLAEARRTADLSEQEERLLASVERPIVLARRRRDSALAPEVAPRNPLVGLLLPYAPLHQLLLSAAGRPLVMTSGNLSEEPLAYRNDEALARLAGIADLLLLHDREIATRCDDSVARVIAGAPVVLRRSRGYVPRPVPVARPFARPVLACGAQLKNTFCIGVGDSAWLGPHIGDLDNEDVLRSFAEAVERMQRFLGVTPELVAHDLHPDYVSTRYALERAEPRVGVQHHHAHVVSAMAEHGLAGPVLGVAFDGTGYGTDGSAWGGELLLAHRDGFERLATLRPLRLAGGDTAIREVWRLALAALEDAFPGQPPLEDVPLLRRLPPVRVTVVREMLARGVNAPPAHGAGRYFDAIGALVLGRETSSYEGQVALEWNLVADPAERDRYPFTLDCAARVQELDLRPLTWAVMDDLRAGVPAPTISGRFHNTLVEATAALVRAALRRTGRLPVVLTGGCFQNARLAEGVIAALQGAAGVLLHRSVPPGDGGIALGQAVAADAVARKSL